jgi:Phage integrase family
MVRARESTVHQRPHGRHRHSYFYARGTRLNPPDGHGAQGGVPKANAAKTLADLGISRKEASEAMVLAEQADAVRDAIASKLADNKKPLTLGRSTRIARDAKAVSPHALRHTYALRCLRHGGDVVAVSKLLGHSSITPTQRYVDHLAVGELRATVPHLPGVAA